MDYDFLVRLIADYAVFPIVLIGGWVLLTKVPRKSKYQAYCRIIMAGLTAFLIAKLRAVTYQPSDVRPYELLGVVPGAS